MPEYRIIPGTPQDMFGKLRAKVQVFGGGFGNGKTAAAIVQKVLHVAKLYPGANILVARSTYPKLNDTIRKEFIKWCPPSWIKSFPMSKNSENTCTLTNGTTINFRYVAQQGSAKSEDGGSTTSNLLSATYDLIVVDQLEDPEITEKDFLDLLGRLRGSARYIGKDSTMPLTGPRWFIACVNPTRNWVYRKLIAPLKKYQEFGIIDDELMCEREPRDIDGIHNEQADKPILDENGKPLLLIELVEGSTYTNKHNLGEDFIKTLESSYKGQNKDRFLYGEWAAYEGLVHPEFSEPSHCIPNNVMREYFNTIVARGVLPRFIEGYDFGIVKPCCYLFAFTDRYKNIFIAEGFYRPEQDMSIDEQQKAIWEIRNEWGCEEDKIWADPSVFRKTQVQKNTGAKTIAKLFEQGDNGVKMRAADNEVLRGITKVNNYLAISDFHRHPITGVKGAPHLYIATELVDVISEFTSYYWLMDKSGKRIDEPVDDNDHAMNAIKYMIAKEPDLAIRVPKVEPKQHLTKWREAPERRYG